MLSPVCSLSPTPGGAHSLTAPALAWIVPVIDRCGRVTPERARVELDVDALRSPSTEPRSTVAEPGVELELDVAERRAGEVDVACPALSCEVEVEATVASGA